MPKSRNRTAPNSGRAHVSLRAKSNPRNGRQSIRESAQVLDLSRYAIGTRLRHARLMRGSRLKDVADAALREARLQMIASKKFSHPYYWAPFVLIGNK